MKSWQTESSEAKLQKQINKQKKKRKKESTKHRQQERTRGKAIERATVEYALSSTPVTETGSQFQ